MIRWKLFNSQVILGAKAYHSPRSTSSRQIIDNFIILLLVGSVFRIFQGKMIFFLVFHKMQFIVCFTYAIINNPFLI